MAHNPVSLDNTILRLAREIAIDLHDIETILKNNHIELERWDRIKQDPRFAKLLESELLAWNSATNTHERTKLKAAILIEEWLVEANARIWDEKETLPAKTELLKLLSGIAGMGRNANIEGGGGERLTVTINLGADARLQFEKTTPQLPREVTGEVLPSPTKENS